MVDEKKSENTRLVESLERLDKHIESLSETKKTIVGSGLSLSGSTASGTLGSGTVISLEDLAPKELVIPVSGLFLAKIMPEVTIKKVDNKGFF